MQRGAELGQRLDLAALAHFIIAPLQMIEDQLLAGQFPRRDEFHFLGGQPRRRLELVEGFVLPLFPLQLQPLGKSLAGFFQFFLGGIAGDSFGRTFRTRQKRRRALGWSLAEAANPASQQNKGQPNKLSPAHVPIVTGKRRRDREFRAGQCTFVYSPLVECRRERPARAGGGTRF